MVAMTILVAMVAMTILVAMVAMTALVALKVMTAVTVTVVSMVTVRMTVMKEVHGRDLRPARRLLKCPRDRRWASPGRRSCRSGNAGPTSQAPGLATSLVIRPAPERADPPSRPKSGRPPVHARGGIMTLKTMPKRMIESLRRLNRIDTAGAGH
jgi:hypothetical protein